VEIADKMVYSALFWLDKPYNKKLINNFYYIVIGLRIINTFLFQHQTTNNKQQTTAQQTQTTNTNNKHKQHQPLSLQQW